MFIIHSQPFDERNAVEPYLSVARDPRKHKSIAELIKKQKSNIVHDKSPHGEASLPIVVSALDEVATALDGALVLEQDSVENESDRVRTIPAGNEVNNVFINCMYKLWICCELFCSVHGKNFFC